MDLFTPHSKIVDKAKKLFAELDQYSIEDKIEFINQIKKELHRISPMKDEPVDCVTWVKNDFIKANDYNPNRVAPPEMKLLEHSIMEDGYSNQ